MSSKVKIASDPVIGVETVFHDTGNGTFGIEDRFDAEPTIEANKERYNSAPSRWKHDANNHIASIPLPLYYDLKRKGIVADRKAFLKWLEDPDNRAFKVRPGRLV